MARTGHKGHPVCEYTSKAACEKARRIAIGQCVSMIDEDHQCPHWGTGIVEDRGYCGQHLNSVYLAVDNARRAAAIRVGQERRIDAALAWHREHPSIHDPMPVDTLL